MGTTGGALHLAFGSKHQPFWLIRNNTFLSNVAYFEGNAIYIKGNEGVALQGLLVDCTFQYNQGVNVAFGAAVAIDGSSNVEVPLT